MDLLIDLMNIITDAMIGADQINRNAAYSRNTDISWFIQYLEDSGSTRGLAAMTRSAWAMRSWYSLSNLSSRRRGRGWLTSPSDNWRIMA